ncbi:phenylacetate--CoA ligase family protein [Hydrogenophaga sp. NFH-34]|uniref:phenylacetate--CoA ligase family protein n=1 Tax=Hydrogenophaga sp. NFH-34 TaxID=2744446 RepID=UPI001F2DE001|nr:phenylacetate--CoA ligase family protein [Hydrogenophaga sp. NFH-34]
MPLNLKADHPALPYLEWVGARQPLRAVKGLISAHLAYPVAEHMERREVRPKLTELQRHYRVPFAQRLQGVRDRVADTVAFAMQAVPYYRDTFCALGFDPDKLRQDLRWLQDLPWLTKDIIREQGDRLLSRPLAEVRHHACKTGGSTGQSCVIHYDQPAADHSAAVTLYCRQRVGKTQRKPELHFACRFPGDLVPPWPSREDFKCFAMNRSNIFFGALDDAGLEEIWATLLRRRPYLIHGHPSTIYALACHIEKTRGSARAFRIFESSGELMEDYQRHKIAQALQCRVVNRYGLAELGVVAYELEEGMPGMQLLDSEAWCEMAPVDNATVGSDRGELTFTALRNRLMPLIRYRSGDLGRVEQRETGVYLTEVIGRIHDMVPINGVPHATHHIQDVLDHRVGGIQEFQIDLRSAPPVLRIVVDTHGNAEQITERVQAYWPGAFDLQFVQHADLVRVGSRAKFRHVVTG